ncbi:ABC transporter ATP-binding protein [Actinospica durhamensis]|uniref:ABC transporter ATP-binding protein n=1 Tax=Actinospica durhamensis TaxID=1508375 RepID=A0A941ETI6_9ACTN|nr:ABC transporter ATP-binding protein [Actinospica durhamensis]MBR7834804.1 ABC transporter ATP-binding protein [Actinospica durhamensis]
MTERGARADPADGDAPLLRLDRVTRRFGRVVAAQDLSLQVPRGGALGVVGPNGAGKSTLFALIGGQLRPQSGQIRLAGRPLEGLSPAARARLGIGRTYQVPRPFGRMTVFENALVGASHAAGLRGRAADRAAYAALERTGLAAAANEQAERLGLLSRKRLEVARALAAGPSLLLLDEVAGGLTEPEVDELAAIIRALRDEGMTVVWIEHVVRALTQSVERLVCLAQGRILADGTPERVLADPAVREAYLGVDIDAGTEGPAA